MVHRNTWPECRCPAHVQQADGGVIVTHTSATLPGLGAPAREYLTTVLDQWKYASHYPRLYHTTFTTGTQSISELKIEASGNTMGLDNEGPTGVYSKFNLNLVNLEEVIGNLTPVGKFLTDNPFVPEPFYRVVPVSNSCLTLKLGCHHHRFERVSPGNRTLLWTKYHR